MLQQRICARAIPVAKTEQVLCEERVPANMCLRSEQQRHSCIRNARANKALLCTSMQHILSGKLELFCWQKASEPDNILKAL